jgi:hypothetical protein
MHSIMLVSATFTRGELSSWRDCINTLGTQGFYWIPPPGPPHGVSIPLKITPCLDMD